MTRAISRPQNQRRGNRIFYAVAEGEGTEYDYLGYLNQFYGSDLKFLIRSHGQRRGLSASRVVEEADRAVAEPGIEVWALFDHDGRPDNVVIMERLRAAHPAFAHYRDGDKRIDARRFEALHEDDNIRGAVDRARRLSTNFTHETPSYRDPSTDVYLLIERLGIVRQRR